ncbi:MAG: ribbon-helix-helix protein, CopG family [Acidobacteriota bacterium]|nr:ribbon-helix-helix protein, CopG family [Acidobacteriota bacterium]
MSIVSLKMPEELATLLAAAARRRGVTRSAVIRDALESYLRRVGTGNGSAADVAGDLIGVVEGPRDLSSHPKHLKGFGR